MTSTWSPRFDLRRDVLPLTNLHRGEWRIHRRPYWHWRKRPIVQIGWRMGGFWAAEVGPIGLYASVFTRDGRRF